MKKWCFLLLLAGACSPWQKGSGEYSVYIDPGFTEAQEKLVNKALDKWRVSVDETVTFTNTDNWEQKDNLITICPSTVVELTTEYGRDNTSDDWHTRAGITKYLGTSSLVMLATDLFNSDEEFLQATEHELGHAMGLQHRGEGELMYHSVDGAAKEVTCNDVEQFCEIWGCRTMDLAGCK